MAFNTNLSPTLAAILGLQEMEEEMSLTHRWIIKTSSEYLFTVLLIPLKSYLTILTEGGTVLQF